MAKAVKTALAMNLGICIIKTIAAVITRSAGMTAEAVHSLADSGNQVLLLLGMKRSKQDADDQHPFGYGKEEYFWSFIVGEILFVLGAIYSVYEGFHKLFNPEPLQHVYLNLVVLGTGMLMEGYSWYVARKELNCSTSELYKELVDSKDSSLVTIFVEDTGAMIGLAVAFMGNLLSLITGDPVYDAVSSIIIGLLLGAMAYFLVNEMRKLVVGEAIDKTEIRYIRRVLNSSIDVKKVGSIKTMQLGNNDCVVCAEVDFRDDLTDGEIEYIIAKFREKIMTTLPEVKNLYLQPTKL